MIHLNKKAGRDFVILNLTDTQLSNEEWADGSQKRAILEYTVATLVGRIKPDLITVTGDLAWAGHTDAYEMVADMLDGFGIPWACVWGNHDNQEGAEGVDRVVDSYLTRKNFVYEKGDPRFGNGNYIISVEEGERPVTAIIMADSHDRFPFVGEDGTEKLAWGKLIPEQVEWITATCREMKAAGYTDGMLVMHIPFFEYRLAADAAYKSGMDRKAMTLADAEGDGVWNPGYEGSVGVQHEGIGSYPVCDGIFADIKGTDFIKTVVTGHEHINNFIIDYEGVKLVYALKTGAGCYWEPVMNGGTVIRIGDGVKSVTHEYVDVSHLL